MTIENAATLSSDGQIADPTAASSENSGAGSVEANAINGENLIMADSAEAPKEDTMSSDNVVQITARPVPPESAHPNSAIQLHQPVAMAGNRPVMPSDLEVVSTMTVAGVRPVVASHLELFGSFLNGRPIAASPLKVCEMLPGGRPIFVSEFKMVEGALLPGDRPVMISDPQLLQASTLPGGRPIASNEIVDPEPATLMGYLD